MVKNMKLLVVIVTFNAMKWADRCFGSLYKSKIVPDVYVIDNGSTDGTQNYIQQTFPKVMLHQSMENLGFGAANNLGLQYAKDHDYDYVYLLNQDAWVFAETFEGLILISRNYPNYGILSPFQMEANMQHIDRNFKKNVCSWKSSPELLDYLYLNKNKPIIDVNTVMAAHWFITRKCLLKVGGFSPTFYHYAEDDNYLDRVNYHGFKIGITPSLKVVHDREDRLVSKNKLIYMKYTQMLRKLSNPKLNICLFKLFFVHTMKNVKKYKSLLPIKYTGKIVLNYSKIIRNKEISINNTSAFLK